TRAPGQAAADERLSTNQPERTPGGGGRASSLESRNCRRRRHLLDARLRPVGRRAICLGVLAVAPRPPTTPRETSRGRAPAKGRGCLPPRAQIGEAPDGGCRKAPQYVSLERRALGHGGAETRVLGRG